MRKNFNFKAEWAVAIQMLRADMHLTVYQVILTMGLHDVSLEEAVAANNAVISDPDAMNLLLNVEKILTRRRRARERAAARRLARAANTPAPAANTPVPAVVNTPVKANSTAKPASTATEPAPISATDNNPAPSITDHTPADATPTPPRHRRHKHKKRKSRIR